MASRPADQSFEAPAASAPSLELFLPAPAPHQRPHRLRDLAMLGLAVIVFTSAAAHLFAQPAPATQSAR